jgi:hypothetical protein
VYSIHNIQLVDISFQETTSQNMFDNMDDLLAPKISDSCGELDRYLSTNVEDVCDPLMWWTERKSMYPALSRMALDYLTIPGEHK